MDPFHAPWTAGDGEGDLSGIKISTVDCVHQHPKWAGFDLIVQGGILKADVRTKVEMDSDAVWVSIGSRLGVDSVEKRNRNMLRDSFSGLLRFGLVSWGNKTQRNPRRNFEFLSSFLRLIIGLILKLKTGEGWRSVNPLPRTCRETTMIDIILVRATSNGVERVGPEKLTNFK